MKMDNSSSHHDLSTRFAVFKGSLEASLLTIKNDL